MNPRQSKFVCLLLVCSTVHVERGIAVFVQTEQEGGGSFDFLIIYGISRY